MIVTKQKNFNDILKAIGNNPVFIIGCNECATVCHTGGEEEIASMKKAFKEKGVITTGSVVLEPACNLQKDKLLLKKYKKEINEAKKILVLACGNGAQTVSEIIENVDIIPGTETLFLGEIKHANYFEKRCVLCGECIQDLFEGICPVARCPKGILNGPCGGAKDGKCEIGNDVDCVWDIIYKKLKEKNQLYKLKEIRKPKAWSKSTESRRIL